MSIEPHCFTVTQQPRLGQDSTNTHTHTHMHAHKAKICASIGIQTRDFSKRAVQDPRLRTHCQRDRRRA